VPDVPLVPLVPLEPALPSLAKETVIELEADNVPLLATKATVTV
jgi:hypothetical protein